MFQVESDGNFTQRTPVQQVIVTAEYQDDESIVCAIPNHLRGSALQINVCRYSRTVVFISCNAVKYDQLVDIIFYCRWPTQDHGVLKPLSSCRTTKPVRVAPQLDALLKCVTVS